MSEHFLPLQGKLSIPEIIYEGEPQEVSKELVETLMLSEAVEISTIDQNDFIPVILSDETGHRSIDKLISADALAEEVAKKIEIPEIPIPQQPEFPDLYTTEDIQIAESITAEDKLLFGTPAGNRIGSNQMLIDLVKDQIGNADGPIKVPLVEGFSIVVKDFIYCQFKNGIWKSNDTAETIFGVNVDDIVSISVYDMVNAYVTVGGLNVNKTIFVSVLNNTFGSTLDLRIAAIVRDSTVQPQNEELLLKGVRAVTIPVDTAFAANVQSIVVGNVSDYGISVNNVIGCCGSLALDRGTTNERVATAVIGVLSTGQLVIRESSGYTTTARIKMDGVITLFVRDMDIEDITLDDLPAATEITETDKLLLGQDAQNKSIEMSRFMDFMRENGLFDLDGKGRPLLPGYGIVTVSKNIMFSNGDGTAGIFSEVFPDLSIKELTLITVFQEGNIQSAIDCCYIDQNTNEIMLINRGKLNGTFPLKLVAIYKLPVPYEPGLKTVKYTKTFTLRPGASASASISFCEFNLSDLSQNLHAEDIVNVQVIAHNTNSNVYNAVPILVDHGLMRIFCLIAGGTYADQTFDLIFTVKDYSSIGPAIVTEGIRMITIPVDAYLNVGYDYIDIGNVSDYKISLDDVVGIPTNLTLENNRPATFIVGILPDGSIRIRESGGNIITSRIKIQGKVTLLVKVPVVESRRPFIKDVEVTLNGSAGVQTGIVLDGSEEVGGYTIDNLTSYSASMITPKKWLALPTINSAYEIVVSGIDNGQTGKSVIRIKIE